MGAKKPLRNLRCAIFYMFVQRDHYGAADRKQTVFHLDRRLLSGDLQVPQHRHPYHPRCNAYDTRLPGYMSVFIICLFCRNMYIADLTADNIKG